MTPSAPQLDRIRELLHEHATNAAIARALGVHNRWVPRWIEWGRLHDPRPQTAPRIDDRYWGRHSPLWTRVLRIMDDNGPFCQTQWCDAYATVTGLPSGTVMPGSARAKRVVAELRRYRKAGIVSYGRGGYRVVRIPEMDFDD